MMGWGKPSGKLSAALLLQALLECSLFQPCQASQHDPAWAGVLALVDALISVNGVLGDMVLVSAALMSWEALKLAHASWGGRR